MGEPLRSRPLGPQDEAQLRVFWSDAPHAHLFAIPDLEHLGWHDPRLSFRGWFAAERLVGYGMHFGPSAQWQYSDPRAVPELATWVAAARPRIHFATGLEASTRAVLERVPGMRIVKEEPSTVARLFLTTFDRTMLLLAQGQARRATLADLDALAAVHVAAPDQFTRLDFATRRRGLRAALTDGWRRIFLAEREDGTVVAAAQSIAEGSAMAVIGGVVTHPTFRGHGYATAATAHLCAALLAEGRTPYLFYRRTNQPAARVYQKIGFQPLGDALLVQMEWTDDPE